MNPEAITRYPDRVRPFLDLGFDYRGHEVRYRSFVSAYDGCVMYRVLIDGQHYPFAHRDQGSAEAVAKRIIDSKMHQYTKRCEQAEAGLLPRGMSHRRYCDER